MRTIKPPQLQDHYVVMLLTLATESGHKFFLNSSNKDINRRGEVYTACAFNFSIRPRPTRAMTEMQVRQAMREKPFSIHFNEEVSKFIAQACILTSPINYVKIEIVHGHKAQAIAAYDDFYDITLRVSTNGIDAEVWLEMRSHEYEKTLYAEDAP